MFCRYRLFFRVLFSHPLSLFSLHVGIVQVTRSWPASTRSTRRIHRRHKRSHLPRSPLRVPRPSLPTPPVQVPPRSPSCRPISPVNAPASSCDWTRSKRSRRPSGLHGWNCSDLWGRHANSALWRRGCPSSPIGSCRRPSCYSEAKGALQVMLGDVRPYVLLTINWNWSAGKPTVAMRSCSTRSKSLPLKGRHL